MARTMLHTEILNEVFINYDNPNASLLHASEIVTKRFARFKGLYLINSKYHRPFIVCNEQLNRIFEPHV